LIVPLFTNLLPKAVPKYKGADVLANPELYEFKVNPEPTVIDVAEFKPLIFINPYDTFVPALMVPEPLKVAVPAVIPMA